ncbi:hypothetical protein O181_012409 [Austropuccinia psidii MF-1]|uniref:Uncharacterized protein n=1 Tax=Austropuccinia psidii MF-1 TaxID=1389203 RepID=A0A9Q3BUL5_9BASI|nr:hypothetical protein [Austropuccinia psidii MF-1]
MRPRKSFSKAQRCARPSQHPDQKWFQHAKTKKNTIVLVLQRSFALFKKLGIEAKELEGLLAQAACHAPATLDQATFDQLVPAAILLKGKEKPSLTFVGQVILNVSQTRPDTKQPTLPFVYKMSDPPESTSVYPWPKSPYRGWKMTSNSDIRHPQSSG